MFVLAQAVSGSNAGRLRLSAPPLAAMAVESMTEELEKLVCKCVQVCACVCMCVNVCECV